MDLRRLLLDWRRNAAPGLGLLMLAVWFFEQFVTVKPWFAELPFGWMALLAFAFWLGYDLFQANGRMRLVKRHFESIGQFGDTYNKSLYCELGPNHGGKQHVISIYTTFTLKRNATIDVYV
jgi:hypothetical protein